MGKPHSVSILRKSVSAVEIKCVASFILLYYESYRGSGEVDLAFFRSIISDLCVQLAESLVSSLG